MITSTKSGLSNDEAVRLLVASSKCPCRRTKLPQQAPQFTTQLQEALASPFRLKIMLAPEPVLLFRISRLAGTGDILDLIARARHKGRAHVLAKAPQRYRRRDRPS